MLTIQPTTILTGVCISGDFWDLDALITAIYEITGEENRYLDFQGARKRILSVCLAMRQATKGEKNIEFISNGMHKAIEKNKNVLTPKKNVYFSTEVLMPELIFTALALNDFIRLYEEHEDNSQWNYSIATVRQFQAAVGELLESLIEPEHYMVFLEMLHTKQPAFFRYATQYVDILNTEYLQLSRDERKEHLVAYAIRLLIEDESYTILKEQLLEVAKTSKHEIHELEITVKYPELIDW